MLNFKLPRSPKRFWLATTILVLQLAPQIRVHADSFTWDGDAGTAGLQDGGGNWDTSAVNRWNNGAYQAWVNSLVTPNSAIFGNGSGAAGTVTLTEAIVADDLTFNTTGSGTYTIASSAAGSTLTLTGIDAPAITTNVDAAISALLSGSGGMTKLGASTLTLSGSFSNTLTGTTNVTNGTLLLNKTGSATAIAGDVLINGGTLTWGVSNMVADTASVTLTSGALGFNGKNETIKSLSIEGGNSNNGGGGNGGLITINETLSASNSGTLGLNSGGQWSAQTVSFTGSSRTVLSLTGNSSAGAGGRISRVTVGSGGLSMTGQTISLNKGTSNMDAFGSELLLNGNVVATGSNSITIGGTYGVAQVNLGTTVSWDITTASDSMTVASSVVGTGGLTKTGAGALKLTGAEANSYGGLTTVSNGTLNLGKTAGVNAIAGNILVNGGTLDWDTPNQLDDAVAITLTSGALKFDAQTETFASLTQSGGTTNPGGGVNGGVVNITGTLRVSGGSNINLNSSGTWNVGKADFSGYAGTVLNLNANSTVNINRFSIGSGGLVLTGQTLALNRGTLPGAEGSEVTLGGNVTASGGNVIAPNAATEGVSQVNLNGAIRTWDITGTTTISSAVVSTTVTAKSVDAVATAGGLLKTGSGSLVLNAANTYTGATTVNDGTLFVHGTLNGTSGLSVDGGTFGGKGVVTAPVTVAAGASLQGGDGVTAGDDLEISGDLTLASNSVIKLTLGAGLTHSTLTRVSGVWSFALGQTFTFNGSGVTTGVYDNIITGLTGTEPWLANLGTWQISNPNYLGVFTQDGTNVDLNLTAIPEPGAGLLLCGSLGLWLGRRRCRTTGR